MELSATSNIYSSTGQLCSSSPEVNSLSCLTEYIARSNLRPKLRKSQPDPRVMFSRSIPENAESSSRHPFSSAEHSHRIQSMRFQRQGVRNSLTNVNQTCRRQTGQPVQVEQRFGNAARIQIFSVAFKHACLH